MLIVSNGRQDQAILRFSFTKKPWLFKFLKPYEVCSCIHVCAKLCFAALYFIPLLWAECPMRVIGSSSWPPNFCKFVFIFASLSFQQFFLPLSWVNFKYTGFGLWTAVRWFRRGVWRQTKEWVQHRFVFTLSMCQTSAQMAAFRYNVISCLLFFYKKLKYTMCRDSLYWARASIMPTTKTPWFMFQKAALATGYLHCDVDLVVLLHTHQVWLDPHLLQSAITNLCIHWMDVDLNSMALNLHFVCFDQMWTIKYLLWHTGFAARVLFSVTIVFV